MTKKGTKNQAKAVKAKPKPTKGKAVKSKAKPDGKTLNFTIREIDFSKRYSLIQYLNYLVGTGAKKKSNTHVSCFCIRVQSRTLYAEQHYVQLF